MSTQTTTTAHISAVSRPRVWLVAGIGSAPDPTDRPVVRDNRMVTWQPEPSGQYRSVDGYHHATWTELHTRFDLVEVLAA